MKTEKEIRKRLKYLESQKHCVATVDFLIDEASKMELKWVLEVEDEKVNTIDRFRNFFRRMFKF